MTTTSVTCNDVEEFLYREAAMLDRWQLDECWRCSPTTPFTVSDQLTPSYLSEPISQKLVST
jgi:hypothetical protein